MKTMARRINHLDAAANAASLIMKFNAQDMRVSNKVGKTPADIWRACNIRFNYHLQLIGRYIIITNFCIMIHREALCCPISFQKSSILEHQLLSLDRKFYQTIKVLIISFSFYRLKLLVIKYP